MQQTNLSLPLPITDMFEIYPQSKVYLKCTGASHLLTSNCIFHKKGIHINTSEFQCFAQNGDLECYEQIISCSTFSSILGNLMVTFGAGQTTGPAFYTGIH